MKEYDMYRFYKGENVNPFDEKTQNSAHMFWFYESIFERDFGLFQSSDWYAFFAPYGKGDGFIHILSESDHDKPTLKAKPKIFELWLEYLFENKLYAEYGGENWYKETYYSITI